MADRIREAVESALPLDWEDGVTGILHRDRSVTRVLKALVAAGITEDVVADGLAVRRLYGVRHGWTILASQCGVRLVVREFLYRPDYREGSLSAAVAAALGDDDAIA